VTSVVSQLKARGRLAQSAGSVSADGASAASGAQPGGTGVGATPEAGFGKLERSIRISIGTAGVLRAFPGPRPTVAARCRNPTKLVGRPWVSKAGAAVGS